MAARMSMRGLEITMTSDEAAQAGVDARAALIATTQKHLFGLQVFTLSSFTVMCLLSLFLIAYLRYNRNVALTGDAVAARKLILPAFEPLLWIMAAATGGQAIYLVYALANRLYNQQIQPVMIEAYYAGRQFVFLVVLVFMFQSSVSMPAVRRTITITLVLSFYTVPLEWMFREAAGDDTTYYAQYYWIMQTLRLSMLVFYGYAFVWTPSRASVRSIREYCIYTTVYQVLYFLYAELFRHQLIKPGFATIDVLVIWAAIVPIFIWRVLRADTDHWRGMGERAVSLQNLFRQKRNMHECISSQGLHVLIEMHRKYIIDFAYLELKQRIGMGASAVVFKGLLHSKTPVAVKVYTPTILTDETVAEFSHEAALCGALNHPNIVRFYGMCVCPPTICLVSELCLGSLDFITVVQAERARDLPRRQQFLINVGYMLDAARAVAYIHSFSPPFVHRDIKPENFLVDSQHTVKLTDFGDSRSLPSVARASIVRQTQRSHSATLESPREGDADQVPETSSYTPVPASAQPIPQMTVKGTVDYMAPEMIQGKAGLASYGESADVYSLAITMWDILNPGVEKFPQLANRNHLLIFDHVVDGHRPPLRDDLHPRLRQIMESAWHADMRLRPAAHQIVATLEEVQEELQAVFALELIGELQQFDVTASSSGGDCAEGNGNMGTFFSGVEIVQRCVELSYTASAPEAVRMGCALMDAGLLHHVRHGRPFEHSTEMYYFDEEHINLCRPILGDGHGDGHDASTASGSSSQKAMASVIKPPQSVQSRITSALTNKTRRRSSGTRTATQLPLLDGEACACRKYGQRIEHPRAPRRRQRRRVKILVDENVLTTKLLADEQSALQETFDAFDAVALEADSPAARRA